MKNQIIQLITEASFNDKKNFNIASTIISDNVRISTAAIFYDEIFGERFQLETWIFKKEGRSLMKIHDVFANQKGLDYCVRFHTLTASIVDIRLKQNEYPFAKGGIYDIKPATQTKSK